MVLVLILALVGGMVLAGWLGLALFVHGQRARKKAEARAPEILDAAFSGSLNVVFKVNMESPSFETVVLGAQARGYRLMTQTNDTDDGTAKTLIFERVQATGFADSRGGRCS